MAYLINQMTHVGDTQNLLPEGDGGWRDRLGGRDQREGGSGGRGDEGVGREGEEEPRVRVRLFGWFGWFFLGGGHHHYHVVPRHSVIIHHTHSGVFYAVGNLLNLLFKNTRMICGD